MSAPISSDSLDDKLNRVFSGRVVRKDLVRRVKVGANVPAFVLEYPRGWDKYGPTPANSAKSRAAGRRPNRS